MISEYCPIGSTFGGRKTNIECNAICTRDKFTLIDRVNEKNRVMTDLFCRSYILNPVPLNLFDEISILKEIGIKTFRFDFRDESYEDVKKIINMYRNNEVYDKSNYTKGQFRRGIEEVRRGINENTKHSIINFCVFIWYFSNEKVFSYIKDRLV